MAKTQVVKKHVKSQQAVFPAGNTKYTPHKYSSLVPGEMSPEEYKALCTSIREDGLQNAIVLFEGQILDGRHRYQACIELGTPLKAIEFKGTQEQARALSLDNNLHRRTLNSMQKAIVAARMHIDSPKKPGKDEHEFSQRAAAERVGVGVATVNLAVRLLNSNNTPLIKRCEGGDATRGEIDELLFDRAASQEAEKVTPVEPEDDDTPEAPGNVVQLDDHRPTVAGKRTHPERRSKETPVSHAVQAFKALTQKERANFVVNAWVWLQQALKDADKMDKVTASKPVAMSQKQQAKALAKADPVEAKVAKGKRKAQAKAAKKEAAAPKPS